MVGTVANQGICLSSGGASTEAVATETATEAAAKGDYTEWENWCCQML